MTEIRPWMLPLIVAAVAVPVVTGMALWGPAVGLAVAALAVAVVLFVAVRMLPYEPIEVAESDDGRRRVLVVATRAVEGPVVEAVADALADEPADQTDVLVVSPALNPGLAHWATDLGRARDDAQVRLVHSLGALAASGIDARGQVGDTDPAQAAEDVLREFAADEVVFATGPGRAEERVVERVRGRLARPLHHVVAGREPRRSAALRRP